MTKKQKSIFLLCMVLLSFGRLYAQDEDLDVNPGKDRWHIKTSVSSNAEPKHVALNDLLQLPLLDAKYSKDAYDLILIPEELPGELKEGDLIYTEGYLRLVALEKSSPDKTDGDYHVQLTISDASTDSCFIVEMPYSAFIDAALRDSSINERTFIRDQLLRGKNPSGGGSVMQSSVYVRVTGQLFYDAIHAGAMRSDHPKYRGKKGMHSYTAWEIHPVIHIEFAPEPGE